MPSILTRGLGPGAVAGFLLTGGLADGSAALPSDLVDAVVARVQAQLVEAGTLTWFGTGVNPGFDTAPLPYGQVGEPDEDNEDLNTQGDRTADGHLEITCFGPTKKEARALGDRVASALTTPPLAFTAGILVYFRQSGRTASLDPDPAPDGGDCWAEVRQFHFTYSYSLE